MHKFHSKELWTYEQLVTETMAVRLAWACPGNDWLIKLIISVKTTWAFPRTTVELVEFHRINIFSNSSKNLAIITWSIYLLFSRAKWNWRDFFTSEDNISWKKITDVEQHYQCIFYVCVDEMELETLKIKERR
jgi:hypothetical protein